MPNRLDFLTEELVIRAAAQIDITGIPHGRHAKEYLVEIENKKYPFKLLVSEAGKFVGIELESKDFSSNPANREYFKEKTGFECERIENNDIAKLIDRYKNHIKLSKLNDEIYKWELAKKYRGRPDVNATDFTNEVQSIEFKNLVYGIGIGVIKHLASDRPEEFRTAFKILFDDDINLQDRLIRFNTETLKVYHELMNDDKFSHHQDERTMATYLAYYDSTRYPFYMETFYRKYCSLVDIKPEIRKNYKYVHYISLLEEFINDYILPDNELLALKKELLNNECFEDENHYILAQDILFQTLQQRIGINKSYWRIGTTHENGKSFWDEMKSGNNVCIGWRETGNLNDFEIESKQDVIELFTSKSFYPDDKRTLIRKAGEVFNFYKNLVINDVVVAQNGDKILGIGVVTDEYIYNGEKEFAHQIPVNWIITDGISFQSSIGRNTTVYQIEDIGIINKIDEILQEASIDKYQIKMEKYIELLKHKKQIILQGPPGTGKTYTAKDIAEQIIFGDVSADKKEQKERLEGSPQFQLVQFHPSYSYEDFVRGITAKNVNGQIEYVTENKIFSKVAEKANNEFKQHYKSIFSIKFLEYKKHVYNLTQKGALETLWGGNGRCLSMNGIPDSNESNFIIHKNTADRIGSSISFKDIEMMFETDYLNLKSSVQNNDDTIKVIYEIFKRESLLELPELKYFIIVIDEINRANLPSVLGELIYALEYRGEKVESMYAIDKNKGIEGKEPDLDASIVIPENLYIIGTMNTADRSVGHIDYAIRRRFAFESILPNINGINTTEKAKTLFLRVSELFVDTEGKQSQYVASDFDYRDIQIGHSYFIVENDDELKTRLKYEILPILNEYVKDGLLLEKAKEYIETKIKNYPIG